MNSGYHNIGICEQTRGVDKLFKLYEDKKNETLEIIRNNPLQLCETLQNFESSLPIDKSCPGGLKDGPFLCSQCCNIKRLIDIREHSMSFTIKCGEMAGESIILHEHSKTNRFCMVDLGTTRRANDLHLRFNTGKRVTCIMCDNFTLTMLTGWIIESIFKPQAIPYIKLYTGFTCGETNYILYCPPEYEYFDDLLDSITENEDVRKEDILSLLAQLVTIIKELQKYNFGGQMTIDDFYFDPTPVSFKYEGINIISPFSIIFNCFSHVGITLGNYRFLTKSVQDDILSLRTIVSVDFQKRSQIVGGIESDWIKIDLSTYNHLKWTNYLGVYNASSMLEFYSVFLSMMSYEKFSNSFKNDPDLNQFWMNMWLPEEFKLIENRISTHHFDANGDLFPLIKGLSLRKDIVECCWELLEK